jgi:hypothetical protein
MSSPPPDPASNGVISPKYWLGPYALAVSTLYLWGYWGSFQINILEYIGIADIVKGAIYPIGSAFAFLALGVILGEIFSPNLEPGGGAHTAIGKVINRWAAPLFAVFVICVALLAIFGPVQKWKVLPFLFALAAYFPLKSSGFLRAELKSEGARSISIYLLTALIPFAYGRGALEANAVLTGAKYSYPTTTLPEISTTVGVSPQLRMRYIGKAGDRYVFFDPTNKGTSFIAMATVPNLTLAQYTSEPVSMPAAARKGASSASAPDTPSGPASVPKPARSAS